MQELGMQPRNGSDEEGVGMKPMDSRHGHDNRLLLPAPAATSYSIHRLSIVTARLENHWDHLLPSLSGNHSSTNG